jgi:hypothetical protein
VPLTTGIHTTAALIATASAAALNNTEAITDANWSFYSSGGNIVATRTANAANDGTFNIAIPGARGVTVAASSANSTAGYFGPDLTNAAAEDARGVRFPYPTTCYFFKLKVTGGPVLLEPNGMDPITRPAGMEIRGVFPLLEILITPLSGATITVETVLLAK